MPILYSCAVAGSAKSAAVIVAVAISRLRPLRVMAGLVTASRVYPTCVALDCATRASPSCVAIHVFVASAKQDVDARPKAGHDEPKIETGVRCIVLPPL